MPSSPHSNKLLETVLQGIGAGVVVLTSDGNCLITNPIAEKILGTLEGLTADLAADSSIFFESDETTMLPAEKNPLRLTIAGTPTDKMEVFVRNKETSFTGWCSINVRPLILEDDINSGGILIIDDISDRKRLADEVARSNRDLQQFAYVAAHDLQEPLRSVIGFGELLQQGLEIPENHKAHDQLRRILAAARRMQTLIAALLSYARIETRAKPSTLCDCDKIVRDIVADKNSSISEVKAIVNVDKLPQVMADGSQLSQVFSNLIGNSLKYKAPGRQPEVRISATSTGRHNHFVVADNGIGMDMQFSNRIFIIFQRLHNKAAYDGVGIGLALCKKIIENHGGKIWVESKIGEGTEMHFTLPKVAKEVASA